MVFHVLECVIAIIDRITGHLTLEILIGSIFETFIKSEGSDVLFANKFCIALY